MTAILRCSQCWRDCAGVRCPQCGAATALVELGDSLGAVAVAERQRAAALARRARAIEWSTPNLFGDDDGPLAVRSTPQPDLFSQAEQDEDEQQAITDYQARRQARIERYEQYATNAAGRRDAAYTNARRITEHIPFGQPILVGHHSERGHRNAIARSDNAMRRSVEESGKAAYWERKAEALANDTSIRRDDPEAVVKLREKIAELTAELDRIKAINACARRHKTFDGIAPALTPREAADLARVPAYQRPDGGGYPAYVLSNRRGNLRRYEQRLKELTR